MAHIQMTMSLPKTLKEIFMVMTTRKKISLASTIHHAYLRTAQMMKTWQVTMRMDGSPSRLISQLVASDTFRHLLFSTLSIQTGTRVTTDSPGNPPFDSLMIAQIVMQVLHWKT